MRSREWDWSAGELMRELLAHWTAVAAAALGCAVLAFGISWSVAPTYSATALLCALNEEEGERSVADFQLGNYLVQDYRRVLTTWEVEEQVLDAMESDMSHEELRRMIDISEAGNTRMLEITAKAPEARLAARVANTYAEVGGRLAATALHADPPELVSRAQAPQDPDGLSRPGMVALGAACGAMLAVAVLAIRFALDQRVRNAESLRRLSGLALLAELPTVSGATMPGEADGLPVRDAPAPFSLNAGLTIHRSYLEGVYTLCARLLMAHPDAQRIAVTSVHRGEGKTTVALHMLRTLARMGKRVVLVDADFRHSALTERSPLTAPGVLHCLTDPSAIDSALLSTDVENAYVMVAQSRASAPPAALSGPGMAALLDELAARFDLVLVDTSPAGEVADSALVANCCDGVLLVVERRRVDESELARIREDVEGAGCVLFGAVMNRMPPGRPRWSVSIQRREC